MDAAEKPPGTDSSGGRPVRVRIQSPPRRLPRTTGLARSAEFTIESKKDTTMTNKLRAAIIGPGNIGTDLLMKAKRSQWIEPVWMVGIEESEGIKRARDFGMKVSTSGVDGLVPHMKADSIQIVFDATSA